MLSHYYIKTNRLKSPCSPCYSCSIRLCPSMNVSHPLLTIFNLSLSRFVWANHDEVSVEIKTHLGIKVKDLKEILIGQWPQGACLPMIMMMRRTFCEPSSCDDVKLVSSYHCCYILMVLYVCQSLALLCWDKQGWKRWRMKALYVLYVWVKVS